MKSEGLNDRSCRYNAQSPYLHCTVHPSGPCEGCPDYERASFRERLSRRSWAIQSVNHSRTKMIVTRSAIAFFGGIPLGIVVLIGIVVPATNSLIVKMHPCWPVIGVTQYCNHTHQQR